MSIRKGDMVMIRVGRDKGKSGKILYINREKNQVTVQGINFLKRHQRPTQTNKQGGIVEKEAPVDISNVMYFDEKLGKPTKLGHKTLEDGKKVRFSKKSGEVIESK